jgi:ubiquinone/menaquinone biosynthesis C-methylase UbiE
MRSRGQLVKDFVTFPVRAVLPVQKTKWGLTSRPDERFEYVAREITGRVLDIGCGRENLFVNNYANGDSVGIDVFRYEGLAEEQIVEDMTHLPFPDESFDTVTFIANFNHIPQPLRDAEMSEAFRVLRKGGTVVVTMGNPVAELTIHRLVHTYDRFLGTNLDMDTERGMHEDEEYFVRDRVIVEHLAAAGFRGVEKRSFVTQWGLNHLLTALRPA